MVYLENEGSSIYKNGSTRSDGSGDPGSAKKLLVKVPLPPSVEYIKTKVSVTSANLTK